MDDHGEAKGGRRSWRRRLPITGLVFVFVGVGCSSATGVSTVAKVMVTPPSATLVVHGQLPFHASPMDAAGQAVANASVFWSSEDTTIATVSPTGLVTGVGPGTVRIAASAGGASGTATVTVSVVHVASITLVPDTLRLPPGGSSRLLATAYNGNGNAVAGLTMQWGSSNPSVATVDQTGTVTGVNGGTSSVTAAVAGVTGTATAIVVPTSVTSVTIVPDTLRVAVGATGTLRATPYDASGDALSGFKVTWGSSNTAVATVDTTGKVTGVAAGTANVSASIGGKTASGTVIVTAVAPPPPSVATVTIVPDTLQITQGKTGQLRATAYNASGQPISGLATTWASGNTAVATVDKTGTVTGVAVGTTSISVSVGGKTASATVIINASGPPPPPSVATVTIVPDTLQLAQHKAGQLQATAFDSSGHVVSGLKATWSSSNTAIATVAGKGKVDGVAPGTATISASISGQTGLATVIVTAAGDSST